MLFVCIGNSCRSPMAEGFARKYGSDVIGGGERRHRTGGDLVDALTIKVMAEKNIDLSDSISQEHRRK